MYNNDEKSEREVKETIPFAIATKRIKYLGINLPKDAKDLYAENYKTLMKEIKDDTNRWRAIPCSWIGRINIGKVTAAAAKSLQLCPTLRPHRRQPTRVPRLWDSLGKNTRVGCHFLSQCMKVKSEREVA